MKKKTVIRQTKDPIRRKAEEELKKTGPKQGYSLPLSDPLSLIHELQVHQIELELQNEELRKERDIAEEAVKKYEDLYSEIYDFTPVAYLTISKEGKIVNLNLKASELLGVERGNLSNTRLTSFLTSESKPVFNEFLKNVFESGVKSSCETRILRSDKSQSVAYIEGNISENESLCLAAMFDITQRKRMELNLLRSNLDLQQFAYVASHDLQEPLRMISSFTQLLQQRYRDKLDSDANEFINYAVEGAKRMFDLLNGLLSYSRIHRKEEVFTIVDMNKVVDIVKSNLHLMIDLRNAEIFHSNLLPAHADQNQMIQLLQNLLTNAIKFSKEIPHISISSVRVDNEVVYSVEDNGIGIEKTYFDRIFRIFQKLHTSAEYEGTGIGLAICKRIIDRHDGSIWLDSEPGKGSRFHFSIPIKD